MHFLFSSPRPLSVIRDLQVDVYLCGAGGGGAHVSSSKPVSDLLMFILAICPRVYHASTLSMLVFMLLPICMKWHYILYFSRFLLQKLKCWNLIGPTFLAHLKMLIFFLANLFCMHRGVSWECAEEQHHVNYFTKWHAICNTMQYHAICNTMQ